MKEVRKIEIIFSKPLDQNSLDNVLNELKLALIYLDTSIHNFKIKAIKEEPKGLHWKHSGYYYFYQNEKGSVAHITKRDNNKFHATTGHKFDEFRRLKDAKQWIESLFKNKKYV